MRRTLTVRDVPEVVLEGLREQARRHHRSMQKEVLWLLTSIVVDQKSMTERFRELHARIGGGMTLDEIHDAIDEGRP